MDKIVPEMLVGNLPSALLGLVIVVLFSASMSTLAAISMSSSSTVTVDFVKGYVKKQMPDSNMGILLRVLCLVFVGISAVLAIVKIDAIVSMMSLSWGVIAGCFIGPYFYGLYSKKVNKAGAYGSMVLSLALTFSLIIGLGYYVLGAKGASFTFGEAVKAGIGKSPFIGVLCMAASMIFTPILSLVFKKLCPVSKLTLDKLFPDKGLNELANPPAETSADTAESTPEAGAGTAAGSTENDAISTDAVTAEH
jgi:Na+/proline symporter